jgi:4-amino-4-deoxy-L-arabinose transferase-like glycosyltransferase
MKVGRRSLIVLLSVSAALLVSWSLAVPIFEAPDEPAHWQYARYLHDYRRLLPYGPTSYEGFSPPAYYLLIAPLAVTSELPAPAVIVRRGVSLPEFPPRYFRQEPGDLGRYWPIRSARLETILMSLLTVWFCCLAGAEASGDPATGLFAGGLVGFWPQFTFRGMNVSNDALLTTFSAAALYLMIRLVRRGFTWGIAVAAALAIAGAFLSKPLAIFLPASLALAVFQSKGPWRAYLIRVAVLGVMVFAIVSPWLVRNQHLYGDPLAHKAMYTAVPHLVVVRPLWSRYFVTKFPLLLFGSFIGLFGWFNLPLPLWAYVAYAGFLGFAGLCWLKWVLQGRCGRHLAVVLLSVCVLNLMVVVYTNLDINSAQGRYLFPAMPALAVLVALGIQSLKMWSNKLTLITLAALAAANLVILVALVIPAYWPIPLNSPNSALTNPVIKGGSNRTWSWSHGCQLQVVSKSLAQFPCRAALASEGGQPEDSREPKAPLG